MRATPIRNTGSGGRPAGWLAGMTGSAGPLGAIAKMERTVAPIGTNYARTPGDGKATLSPPKVRLCRTGLTDPDPQQQVEPATLYEHVLACCPTHTCARGMKGSGG